MKEKLKKADSENDKLKLENEQLRQRLQKSAFVDIDNERLKLEIEQLHQRSQRMALQVLNYKGLSDRGHYNPQNPWDPFQSLEPKLAPDSVQVAELTDKLEQTEMKLHHTQKELQLTKGELEQMQKKVHIIFPKV